ncbi:MAG: non-lysosomal glucosylceramidase [Spirochaetales bacterium]|nr:non-lysosomal glucosylceramidase [Spirochaetales bacterium]
MGQEWPVLRSYEGKFLRRVAMPLGGLGTGTVSLGGRGNLQDWAMMNRPAIGYTPTLVSGMRYIAPFFALWYEGGGQKGIRLLEGPLDTEGYEASEGTRVPNHGFPRFHQCRFDAAYPLAQVHLSDDQVPLKARLQAFNPMVPGDSDKSGMPGAVLTYRITNDSDKDFQISLCGTMINCVGADGRDYKPNWVADRDFSGARNNRNRMIRQNGFAGLMMDSLGVPKSSANWGSLALLTQDEGVITSRSSWAQKRWGDSTLDFWDDLYEDGELEEREAKEPISFVTSLAVKRVLKAKESVDIPFVLSWHFPNRKSWNALEYRVAGRTRFFPNTTLGNYYCTQHKDAWHAAESLFSQRKKLEQDTVEFVHAFCSSSYPAVIKESALFNLSTLRTQTCFRTADGRFYGWEGIHDSVGSCMGNCTHVWNYEHATPYLYSDLAQSMREIEFFHASNKSGHMNFRTELPLSKNRWHRTTAAADGQMGCVMKAYREWKISGDEDFLQKFWPKVKKALSFAWIPQGWDGDEDGVMEGCQHNTMDVEYFGPNPQMQGWYLGALTAAAEMGYAAKDGEFAQKCERLATAGKKKMDESLFNGEYYEQQIEPATKLPPSSIHQNMSRADLGNPTMQLGAGCLIDQLIGPMTARTMGLGNLLDSEKTKSALKSVHRYNTKDGFHDHFNHMRGYALGDEKALLMASYPRGGRPTQPFPYSNEVMTGFEHSTAAHMLYMGMEEEALEIVKAIRERYDGYKRNPFDEAECGHHYARAMASWAHVLALSGFEYSGVEKSMQFHSQEGRYFWANGKAWGICEVKKKDQGFEATLELLGGHLELKSFAVGDEVQWKEHVVLEAPACHVFSPKSLMD